MLAAGETEAAADQVVGGHVVGQGGVGVETKKAAPPKVGDAAANEAALETKSPVAVEDAAAGKVYAGADDLSAGIGRQLVAVQDDPPILVRGPSITAAGE